MRPFHHVTIVFFALAGILLTLYFQAGISLWWFVVLTIVYVHLLVFGAVYIRWGFYVRSFDKGSNPKWLALTFDDGPARETEAILDILKAQNVPAAFFTIGRNAAANPLIVKRWHDEGHLVGNHSYHHGFHFDWQNAKQMAAEIRQTNEAVKTVIGLSPKLFRPPYGVTNPNLAKAIRACGMKSIAWNIRSFDTTAKDKEQLLRRIVGKLKGGDIILLHDSMAITREILTDLITRAHEKGYTFVRVDKMLDLNAYE